MPNEGFEKRKLDRKSQMVTIMIETSGKKIAPSTVRGTTYGYGNGNGNSNK